MRQSNSINLILIKTKLRSPKLFSRTMNITFNWIIKWQILFRFKEFKIEVVFIGPNLFYSIDLLDLVSQALKK